MTDKEYLDIAEATLNALEIAIERNHADIDYARTGSILTLEFENRTKIVINLQPAIQEIWVAAQSGGFHYRYQKAPASAQSAGSWRNTRDGSELYASLSRYASEQAGEVITLSGPTDPAY